MGRLQNNPSIRWVHQKSTHACLLGWGNKKMCNNFGVLEFLVSRVELNNIFWIFVILIYSYHHNLYKYYEKNIVSFVHRGHGEVCPSPLQIMVIIWGQFILSIFFHLLFCVINMSRSYSWKMSTSSSYFETSNTLINSWLRVKECAFDFYNFMTLKNGDFFHTKNHNSLYMFDINFLSLPNVKLPF